MTTQPFVQLINLDRDTERLRQSEDALSAIGLKFDRLSAVIGTDVTDNHPAESLKLLGRALYPGELGCYASHLRAIDLFLETDAPYGIVLEDDAVPGLDAEQRLKDLVQSLDKLPEWDLINLGKPAKSLMTPVDSAYCDASLGLCHAHYPPVTTTAILWSRAGAIAFRRLHSEPVLPVDVAMQNWGSQTDRILAFENPVFAARDGESTIKSNKRKSGGSGLKGIISRIRRIATNKLRARKNFKLRRGK
ncbi:glycosyltransferase family 25 protein [Halocynthiibacter styelae]|uniref:Glycosyltransferase family 25 protein n=1 Tax=Halocynthiibacter styelae TaxID=2761955 RepID=A0A8J7IX01_9RHOB|nr:glycosyltransferase family 25 protein [Paenihalocynthiibacter styelae]MBI1493864.1 glycosyltransferase family 25 protein [Paenihalocynthiibacter styelae]